MSITSWFKSLTGTTKCPSTKTLRKSYKTKSGKTVPAKCVRKTGLLAGKSSTRTKKILAARTKRAAKGKAMSAKKTPKSCGKGKVMRTAYTKKSGVVVPAACIKDMGKVGKGKPVIVLDSEEDHYLSEHGYYDVAHKSEATRMKALKSLITNLSAKKGKMATYNYVIKALNARYVLNRNTNPKVAKIFHKDQQKISAMYEKMKK